MRSFIVSASLVLAASLPFCESFVPSRSANGNFWPSLLSPRYVASRDIDDSADAAEFLDLSSSDLARIKSARSSRTVLPIIILEPLLPGQRLQFGSSDEKFHALIAHALNTNGSNEIGVLGINPYTRRPLNIGVTVTASASSIRRDDTDKAMLILDVVGHRQFECAAEPWMDDTSSFYLADIEYSEGRGNQYETTSAASADEKESIADAAKVHALSASVPNLVEEWTHWMSQTGIFSRKRMKEIIEELGPMPGNAGDRAIWVGSLLNPVRGYSKQVCLEIRPALLSSASDLERITLSCIALQSSIDHMSGKKLLF
eukprot:CAMPEP_0197726652 /NCGR_PEP_ID=MMETSP1434-20131217/16617_1 /TAXON_ID=265543 /ORGANISM="Minutocellus polymorphus, Strain CCMP3303" /LENGTH=314 /DNA_ID=CAMNT_0043312653 /DNA_START=101 /DNA_END=1045 /DNA_ORIENTATION=-